MDISEYYHYTDQRYHILDVPNMYIGNINSEERKLRIMDLSNNRIIIDKVYIPPGVERLFIEIIGNAADNVIRSRNNNIDPGKIEVIIDDRITVKNYGLPIPITIHPEYNIYLPELIFGTLLSSSNYKKDRYGSGVNGLGAKLCNIFSKLFTVTIVNNGVKYTQTWENNMAIRHDPIITKCNDVSSVTVSYIIDSNYFNYNYQLKDIQLFARHCVDIAFNLSVPIEFRYVTANISNYYNFSNPIDYAKLYIDVTNSIIIKHSNYTCILAYTPDKPFELSFVNGVNTVDGGVHVEAIYKMLTNLIKPHINNIRVADVKQNVSLILSYWVKNPVFNSQTKTYFQSPKPKITLSEEDINTIKHWPLIERLKYIIQVRLYKSSDGKKSKYLALDSLEDANLAGTYYSSSCILIYTEGNSATSYATKAISLYENGRNYWGVFTARGKPLNVMKSKPDEIANNRIFNELKQALGLREGVDYTIESNYKTLRYGQLLIMTDSDVDGKHILGLLLNFFNVRFPSLLQRGYVSYLRTPIIKVWLNPTTTIKFYTQSAYEEWSKSNEPAKYKHKYYKGLGSANDNDIKDEFNEPKIIVCIYDEQAPEYFKLAFDDNYTDQRKQWIEQYNPVLNIEDMQCQSISEFLYYELSEYMLANLIRSIPKLIDGLKESQRKALWVAINSKKSTEIKVNVLAAKTTEISGYKHGEKIMAETIAQMAHSFVGSNNLPYYIPEGQLGTRNRGGEDAADPRYTYVRIQPWIPYVFRVEDNELLKQIEDEGSKIEPICFYPIIPMCLVNGVIGIGSGYSSFIPSYNPIDLINWLKCRMNNQPLPELKPWYRGFTGDITFITHNIPSTSDDILGDDQVIISRYSILTTGKFVKEGSKIIVTELPIRRFTYPYKQWLDKLVKDGIIKRYHNLSTADTVKFEIYGLSNRSNDGIIKTLRLQRSFGLSNMVLLDINNHPIRYKSVDDILESFYQQRLEIYKYRKELYINKYSNRINELEQQVKFLELIRSGELVVINQPKDKVIEQLKNHQLNPDLIKLTRLSNCTLDEINNKLAELDNIRKELDNYKSTSVESIWCKELDELTDVLSKIYQ